MPTPRQMILIGLLAVLPSLAYGTLGPDLVALVAVINVVIITAGLYIAFQPTTSSHTATERSAA